MRPEEITISGLPRSPFGGVKADAASELLKRVAWEYQQIVGQNKKLQQRVDELALVQQALELQVTALERSASSASSRDPEELVRTLLGAAQRAAREQRESARRDGELLLKKVRERAQEIEDRAQGRVTAGLAELAKLESLRDDAVRELREALEAIASLGVGGDMPAAPTSGTLAPDSAPSTRRY